jgi:hypothetical protein
MKTLTAGIIVVLLIILALAIYKLKPIPKGVTTTIPLTAESAEALAINEIEREMEEAIANMTAEEVENALLGQ